MNCYVPDEFDFEYFKDYYDKNGVWEHEDIVGVKFHEFKQAVIDYQQSRANCSYNTIWKTAPFEDFGVFEREFTRDQLLFNRKKEVIGGIQNNFRKWNGIEHMCREEDSMLY
jgi:hypothetical protein